MLTDFVGKHVGETAYVIGSGKTLQFYNPVFFQDKLTIGVNFGWSLTLDRVDYMVTKYHDKARAWCKSDRVGVLFVSRGDTGQFEKVIDDNPEYVVFDHEPNKVQDFTGTDFPNDGLVVSYSTITSAMHLAALMGVANIVTVGADCGTLDDGTNVDGYQPEKSSLQPERFPDFELQNRVVANILRKRYGVNVMSMLPFVTPNMEGHRFVSEFGVLNG
jgi:hypothetical protein